MGKTQTSQNHQEGAGAAVTTAARPVNEQSCHWYFPDGKSCYEVPRSDGQGMRPTTLRDARVLGLLPSVTTILQVLAKPQLTTWLVEQAVLATQTTPRLPEEPLDAFIERVLHTEKVQDQESDIAKKRGTEIHDAIEGYFAHGKPDAAIWKWIEPVIGFLEQNWSVVHTEHILIGDGYAGKCDLIATHKTTGVEWVFDFKTTRKLPKESYWEHKMQTAAYLKCRLAAHYHANVYISTVNEGQFVIHNNGDYLQPGEAFLSLLRYWQVANNYHP